MLADGDKVKLIEFLVKVSISLGVIVFCALIGRNRPTLAGLIAVMPLTGLIALIWLYTKYPGNFALMSDYTKGALWGVIPSGLFFLVAFLCFRKQMSLWVVLCASFAVWVIAAFIHQWLLSK
jgi:uncharacterized membrane protein (GlpM family)